MHFLKINPQDAYNQLHTALLSTPGDTRRIIYMLESDCNYDEYGDIRRAIETLNDVYVTKAWNDLLDATRRERIRFLRGG